ncbi:MAG: DUF559 domain-containing protein [Anaerolineae bacterium]|nr:DUF559 domain-containing protein [Anaerolineae bacterium]
MISPHGEVLVAIINNHRDFAIARDEHWYRIPVSSAHRLLKERWPPSWLAFYQTKVFGPEAYAVNYYGRVSKTRVVRRPELFPNELPTEKSDRQYYQLCLHSLEQLPEPIYSRRLRRIVFIPTTWPKFARAAEINDLYDESPLEDRLWAELKRLDIPAERQWYQKVDQDSYCLDFAVFCRDGPVDIETDGDTWHADRQRIPKDNRRDNALQSKGWHVLRFNGRQVRESLTDYCTPKIADTINTLGGLNDEGLVSRVFYQVPDGMAQQLTLFEDQPDYDLD